jgi:hypothetical protein
MSGAAKSRIPQLVFKHEKELLSKWVSNQLAAATSRPGLMRIVHLGVELNDVVTKATLADALHIAIERCGFQIAKSGR